MWRSEKWDNKVAAIKAYAKGRRESREGLLRENAEVGTQMCAFQRCACSKTFECVTDSV